MKHFLVVYDNEAQELVECRAMDSMEAGLEEQFRRERSAGESHLEIVTLAAPSAGDLREAYPWFFEKLSLEEIMDRLSQAAAEGRIAATPPGSFN
ncbi:MAG: hypothetical protein ACYDGR_14900 [Candidatus Dormibacteria bacterium]